MSVLSLNEVNISSEEAQAFTMVYSTLGQKEKGIFDYLHFIAKTNPLCQPSQSTIAKKVKCTREHVNRTIKKFSNFGWFTKIFRPYTSSRYYFTDWMLKIDISSLVHNLFRSIGKLARDITLDITRKITIYSSNSFNEQARHVEPHAHSKEYFNESEIPYYIAKHNLPLWAKYKLMLFNQAICMSGYESLQNAKKNIRIDSEAKYWVETCIEIANERGVEIDWKIMNLINERYGKISQ